MDEFAEKRGMVKMLLDMLKRSASGEVSDGMPKPEEGKGLEIEKVSVIPHKDGMEKMSDGGMAADSDQPERMIDIPPQDGDGSGSAEAVKDLPGPIADEDAEAEDSQNMSNARLMDDDQDNNQSAFNAFLPRKKKK